MKIKKVLYLTHPEQDFGEQFLFTGLCQVLGDENVVTYPYKKTYYGETADDYILDDGKTGYTEPSAWVVPKKPNRWEYDEIKRRMDEFDIIVLSSPRTYALRAAEQIAKDFNGVFPKPLVFTEHEDGDNLRFDIINKFRPSVVFKREMTELIKGVFPLPFSCSYEGVPECNDIEKEIDVFALFGNTHELRARTVAKVLDARLDALGYNVHVGIDIGGSRAFLVPKVNGGILHEDKKFFFTIPPLQPWKKYMESIAKSKIAIAVRGWGRDTVRRWEIPAHNTMMLECDCGILTPYPFVDKVTCVRFKEDLSDLIDKIVYYLEHDDEREAIAKRGHEHLLKYHTNEKRAEYFLDIVEKELKAN